MKWLSNEETDEPDHSEPCEAVESSFDPQNSEYHPSAAHPVQATPNDRQTAQQELHTQPTENTEKTEQFETDQETKVITAITLKDSEELTDGVAAGESATAGPSTAAPIPRETVQLVDSAQMAERIDVNTLSSPKPVSPETSSTPASTSTDAELKSTSETLIRKLLQFSSPRLDIKIVGVLLLEGMMDIFMSHITRLDEENTMTREQFQSSSFQDKLRYARHERETKDLKAMKRSYHGMELLCGSSSNHHWIQESRFDVIANHLFDAFLPSSNANLNHFSKIFQHLLHRHPCDMLEFVIFKNDAIRFFDYMLPYVTQTTIVDAMLSLLFIRSNNSETRKKREASHQRLQQIGFMGRLLDALKLSDDPLFTESLQEFLLRCIEECSLMDNGDVLFACFDTHRGPDLVKCMVDLVVKQKPTKERELTVSVIKAFVKSGTLTTRSSTMGQSVQGPLYEIALVFQELLSPNIPDFCSLLINDRQSVSTKGCPLTLADMELLEIVYQTLSNAPDQVAVLNDIPTGFWKILVNSFFEKSTSNIYHTLFYRFFYLLITIDHAPTLQLLIQKQKLIKRMIDTYEDKSTVTDARGFILLMLNHLRLKIDADRQSTIHRFVASHRRFITFTSTLRMDTLAQTCDIYKWNIASCPRPPPYVGPSPPIRSAVFSPYSATLPLMGESTENQGANDNTSTNGIDLGSDYAYCLGFDETSKGTGTETPVYQSRRNSLTNGYESSRPSSPSSVSSNEFPADLMWGESLTADPPKIKKKKKKKKKTSNSSIEIDA
ncbi:uncharacterized protein BYT42DRAFT_582274 [Radiomyces spectabilis]|uniref:uncharacterized protein n=1 Tax=Radiomyces spectabilis TaxID=64574 RepID=UPI00221E4F53|nr:uncharacterized protein BYT42DRAFT_582274 [Radiomyces spectabilis]KAI8370405.1 hypothetical protein BYT42DRAFT_582274 [Radiomyces spectabilis]